MLSAFVGLATLVGLLFGLTLLFLPTLIARSRKHPNILPIFLVNLFFGWTFIGWVISLVWACTRPATPVLYAPVYPVILSPSIHPTVMRPAATVLPPPTPHQGSR